MSRLRNYFNHVCVNYEETASNISLDVMKMRRVTHKNTRNDGRSRAYTHGVQGRVERNVRGIDSSRGGYAKKCVLS